MTGLDRSKIWTGSLNERALEPQPRQTIGLYDTTLRDGEQSVGVVLMPEEKLEIARALDAAGIDRIEAGFPRVSDDDWRAVELIAAAGLRAEVWGFSRAVQADVEALVELGVAASVIESPISDAKLEALGVSRETMLERIAKAVSFATANGIRVAFFGVDSSRADLDFYRRAYAAAVEAGAQEVVVVDTIGIATPEAAAFLVGETVDLLGHEIPVHWHGHDDFGLATAAAIAAVQAGATWVQGTVNGMGERAGNADLIEVALALEALYGIPTRLDLTHANALAQLVQERAGTPLAPWKAVTGDNLFVRESGAVAAQFHDPPAIEPYAPELVGQGRGIVLGKKSGIDSIRIKAAELGLDVPDEQRAGLLADVKRVGIEKRGLVTHEEFADLVAGKEVRGERIVFPREGLADDTIRVRLPQPGDAPSIVRGLSDKEILRGTGIVVMYELTEEAVVERITTRWPALSRTGDVLLHARPRGRAWIRVPRQRPAAWLQVGRRPVRDRVLGPPRGSRSRSERARGSAALALGDRHTRDGTRPGERRPRQRGVAEVARAGRLHEGRNRPERRPATARPRRRRDLLVAPLRCRSAAPPPQDDLADGGHVLLREPARANRRRHVLRLLPVDHSVLELDQREQTLAAQLLDLGTLAPREGVLDDVVLDPGRRQCAEDARARMAGDGEPGERAGVHGDFHVASKQSDFARTLLRETGASSARV